MDEWVCIERQQVTLGRALLVHREHGDVFEGEGFRQRIRCGGADCVGHQSEQQREARQRAQAAVAVR